MQASLDAEFKSRTDSLRNKKKLESDISHLEVSLDHTNRQLAEMQKSNKKLSITINELNIHYLHTVKISNFSSGLNFCQTDFQIAPELIIVLNTIIISYCGNFEFGSNLNR